MANQSKKDPALHYDMITEAWRYIFGENFHFGYFENPEKSLDEATDALIEKLSDLGNFSEASSVLDIGCGIGNPAFHLYDKYDCPITGISTSQKGIELARKHCQSRGLADRVQFKIADGTDNGLPNRNYDIAWVLESSHLMNKPKLFKECFRVLKKNGTLLLCDIMLKRRPTIIDHLKLFTQRKLNYPLGYLSMKKAFGRGKTETFSFYQEEVKKAGFKEVSLIDISDNVIPTIDKWRSNISTNRNQILRSFTPEKITDFLAASDLLEDLYRDGIHGYALLKAIRP